MERNVSIKKRSRIAGGAMKVLVGIAALILFRYFRESRRREKNEEGD